MTARPILFVAGLGRCGTTMVMTMLDRGRFPVSGPRPAYEVDEMAPCRVNVAWVRDQSGRAVKWVDPLKATISRNDLPTGPVVLHLRRSAREMAASQVKLLASTYGVVNDRRTRRLFERDIQHVTPTLGARLETLGTVYSMDFEEILAHPITAANRMAVIIARHFGTVFDVDAAASVPLPRSPLCAPDLSIEAEMMLEASQ